jgi:hypothetical protein
MKSLLLTLALVLAVIGGTVAVSAISGIPAHASCSDGSSNC